MPAIPSCIIEPIGDQFSGLLPEPMALHPLGCHRPRIADRVVFDKLVQVLVFGSSYERIADATCSATTLRRRRDEWIAEDLMSSLQRIVLSAYDRMIGLDLTDLAVDGCITKAPVWRSARRSQSGRSVQTGAETLVAGRGTRTSPRSRHRSSGPPRFPITGANPRSPGSLSALR